jgi:hypothetical protein
MKWSGSILRSRQCPASTCSVQVDLHVDELSSDDLNRLLNPNMRKRPWYRLLTGTSQSGSALGALNVHGRIAADRLQFRDLLLNHASATIDLDKSKLRISNASVDFLDGKLSGDWKADFAVTPPCYEGTGKLRAVSLTQLSKLMREDWISGSASGDYLVRLSGWSASELRTSASGTLDFDAHDGNLARFTLEDRSPMRFRRLRGHLELADGAFTVNQGKLETPDGIYAIEGTASFKRDLQLTALRASGQGFSITGSLATPRLKALAVAQEQAQKAR